MRIWRFAFTITDTDRDLDINDRKHIDYIYDIELKGVSWMAEARDHMLIELAPRSVGRY